MLANASSKILLACLRPIIVVRQKILLMGPAGPEIKSDSSGEGRQQLYPKAKDRPLLVEEETPFSKM
jgi:hypothetical protein